jgi:hypothetical protein
MDLNSTVFWDVLPCSPVEVYCILGELPALLRQVNVLHVTSSTLMMEAVSFSEMSVHINQSTQHHIPEDRNFYDHHCDNLKYYIDMKIFL